MALTRYDTTKRKDGKWQTKRQGGFRPTFTASTKEKILQENARRLNNASVRIRDVGNRFQKEKRYIKG